MGGPLVRQLAEVPEQWVGPWCISWQRYLNSGWAPGASAGRDKMETNCGIDVRNSSLLAEEFVSLYVSSYRPVVIRGLAPSDMPAWEHWSRGELTRR